MMMYTRDSPLRGSGSVASEAVQAYFRQRGPGYAAWLKTPYVEPPPELASAIINAAKRWGLNSDLVAAQIVHETASWQSRYARERNNPGGIGAVNTDPDQALWFATVEDGLRAHVAHLANYVFGRGEWSRDDPRPLPDAYYGVVTALKELEQRWAWSPPAQYTATPPEKRYGGMIATIANGLVDFAENGTWGPPMGAQIPGFAWEPAATTHYTTGRTQPIRGGAQHYSAGSNSLSWLTKTSGADNPDTRVSATFLVKHEPTMQDRGWQLVRIEDTAWTTAFANPYTVSIEYEHREGQPISDMAYEVLAQTWVDISEYVRRNNLGAIEAIRGHKEWVNNPGLTCPDGIDVGRIARRWRELMTQPPSPPSVPASGLPKLPESIPDPWRGDNPYGKAFWIPKAFIANIQTYGFMATGYAITGVFAQGDMLVQYFERARLELHRDYSVHRGLVGRQLLEIIYPERAA